VVYVEGGRERIREGGREGAKDKWMKEGGRERGDVRSTFLQLRFLQAQNIWFFVKEEGAKGVDNGVPLLEQPS